MAQVTFEALEQRQLLAFGELVTAGFGNSGHVVTNLPPSPAPIVRDLQIAGGNILVGGTGGLVRYLPDGSIDSSFGQSSVAPIGDHLTFTALAADSDGHIYVLGQSSSHTVLTRYLANGTLDTSYRSHGVAAVTTSKTFFPKALAVQPNGKVLVAGVVKNSSTDLTTTRIYRLQADGSPDPSWGDGGLADVQLGATSLLSPDLADNVAGIVVEADGKVLLGGGSTTYFAGGFDPISGVLKPFAYGDAMFAIARFNSDGTADTSYATGGVRRSIYASGVKPNLVSAFAVSDDGTAALATSDRVSGRVIFASFTSDGMLEMSKTAAPGYELSDPVDMTAGPDDRFFLLGENPQRGRGLQLASVTLAGVFSNVVYTEDPGNQSASIASDTGQIAVAPDGNLIVAGEPAAPGYALSEYDAGNAAAAPANELINGRSNSICRDAAGGLHVAYFDAASRVLMYDYRAPDGIWDAPVAVDAGEDAGQYVSVSADAQGNPAIAYFDGAHGNLKFAWRTGDQWHTETVDSRGSVGLYPSMLFYGPGWPAVAYFDKTHGDLKFAVRNMDTGRWGFEYVQRTGIVGRSSSLAIDPRTGRLEIAYVDSSNGLIKWARHGAHGAWTYTTAATTTGGADYLSLAYTSKTQEPSIAFYDAGPANLDLATFSGTSWTTRTLLSKGAVGLYNTLTYDADGAAIYTYDRTHDQALLVRDEGLAAESIVTGGGRYLSVFSNGSIADMIYFDPADGALKIRGAPITID